MDNKKGFYDRLKVLHRGNTCSNYLFLTGETHMKKVKYSFLFTALLATLVASSIGAAYGSILGVGFVNAGDGITYGLAIVIAFLISIYSLKQSGI